MDNLSVKPRVKSLTLPVVLGGVLGCLMVFRRTTITPSKSQKAFYIHVHVLLRWIPTQCKTLGNTL